MSSDRDKIKRLFEKLPEEVLEQLDTLLVDQLQQTIVRVMDEIVSPAKMTEEQSRALSRATGYGLLAHLILTIGKIEGPESAISTVTSIMVEVLEDNFPGMKIDKYVIAQTDTTKH